MTPLLEVLSGDLAGRAYAIDEREFFIGRATSCDIVIPRRYISREHARIVRRDGEWLVEGLSDKNPVLLRNRPARGAPLGDGDVFELCGIQFRFKREGRVPARRGAQQRMSASSHEVAAPRRTADDSWDDEPARKADDSWADAPAQRGVSDSGPVRRDDSWASGQGQVSDTGPSRKADDSWADAPAQRGVSDSGPVRRDDSWASDQGQVSDTGPSRKADDSWADASGGGRVSDSGPAYESRATGSVAGSQRVVFEVDDPADASGPARASGSAVNDQTAELGKVEDPDDPFADVELQTKKKKQADPAREKALRAMLSLGAVGILFAGFFLWKVSRPPPWTQTVEPTAIELAVDEVLTFSYEWASNDPPEGRRQTSLDGREYNWLPNDDYAHVEWAVPHIPSRSIFLIRGKAEGPTRFWLRFPSSHRNVGFEVQVTGESIHEVYREGRIQEYKALSPRELRREIQTRSGSGERYTEERNVDAKEGYYRDAVLQFEAATDAALALQGVLAGKGVVPKEDQALVLACEEREQKAIRDHEEFVSRELALYRASVHKDSSGEQLRQLRRVLRAVNHPCELEFLRLRLIQEECFQVPFNEPVSDCPAAR